MCLRKRARAPVPKGAEKWLRKAGRLPNLCRPARGANGEGGRKVEIDGEGGGGSDQDIEQDAGSSLLGTPSCLSQQEAVYASAYEAPAVVRILCYSLTWLPPSPAHPARPSSFSPPRPYARCSPPQLSALTQRRLHETSVAAILARIRLTIIL